MTEWTNWAIQPQQQKEVFWIEVKSEVSLSWKAMLQTSKNTTMSYLTILIWLFADDSDGFWDDLKTF